MRVRGFKEAQNFAKTSTEKQQNDKEESTLEIECAGSGGLEVDSEKKFENRYIAALSLVISNSLSKERLFERC